MDRRRPSPSKRNRPTLQDSSDSEVEIDEESSNDGEDFKKKLIYSPERMKSALKLLAPALKEPIDESKVDNWKEVESMGYCLDDVPQAELIAENAASDGDDSIEFRCLLCEVSRNLTVAEAGTKSPKLKRLYKKIASLVSSTWLAESLSFYKDNPKHRPEKQHTRCILIDRATKFMLASEFSKSAAKLKALEKLRNVRWEELSEQVLSLGQKAKSPMLFTAGKKAVDHFKAVREGKTDNQSTESKPSSNGAASASTASAASSAPDKLQEAREANRRKRLESLKRAGGARAGVVQTTSAAQQSGPPSNPTPAANRNSLNIPPSHQAPPPHRAPPSQAAPTSRPQEPEKPRNPAAYVAQPGEDLREMTSAGIAERFGVAPPRGSWRVFQPHRDDSDDRERRQHALSSTPVSGSMSTLSFSERELDQTPGAREGGSLSKYQPTSESSSSHQESETLRMNRPNQPFVRPFQPRSARPDGVDREKRNHEDSASDVRDRKRSRREGNLGATDGGGHRARHDPPPSVNHGRPRNAFANNNDNGSLPTGRGRGRVVPAWMARQEAQLGSDQPPREPERPQQPPSQMQAPPDLPPRAFNNNTPPPQTQQRRPDPFPQGPPSGGGRGRGRGRGMNLPAWMTRQQGQE